MSHASVVSAPKALGDGDKHGYSGRTLPRSTKHGLFLADRPEVGVSIGLLVTIAVRGNRIAISPDGLRSLPFLVVFFVVSGFRAAFQFSDGTRIDRVRC